jgi:hypothetical protein
MIGGESREGMLGAEQLGIRKVGNEAFRAFFVGNFGQQGPVTAYRLRLDLFFGRIEIVVETVFGVPHERVDPRLQREIRALELEGSFLVIENIAQGRKVESVHGHCRVEVGEIEGVSAGRILHAGGGYGDSIQTVSPLERRFQPGPVFLEDGYDFLDAFLVGGLVVEVVFGPGEKRETKPLGIIGGQDRLPRDGIVT